MAGLFSGLYSVASVSTARAGSAIPAPLIVAGVAESQCGQWASLLAPILADELQYSSAFPLTTTTGWDGVTGANLFDTQQEQATPPAGLMVPGTAILAALAGIAAFIMIISAGFLLFSATSLLLWWARPRCIGLLPAF
ncbi:hypothetical protein ASN_336 [Acetobacter senegalensis]|uniref:Uncharacterized protein n=2 Tax=Acetobacter senegalensis TaxID=446692 RepID=A0A0U5ETJ7_9PROT|nr:hypothetical protein ASN_336 [Acetobacter senegalensis]